jgi:hypothetical protein
MSIESFLAGYLLSAKFASTNFNIICGISEPKNLSSLTYSSEVDRALAKMCFFSAFFGYFFL